MISELCCLLAQGEPTVPVHIRYQRREKIDERVIGLAVKPHMACHYLTGHWLE